MGGPAARAQISGGEKKTLANDIAVVHDGVGNREAEY